MRMRGAAGLIVGFAMAGCAATAPAPAGPTAPRQCNASAAQSLIGSHVGAVDFERSEYVRVVCTTCATTRDYRPERLNVRFDQQTGVIEKADCG
jgi:hypothetical protein